MAFVIYYERFLEEKKKADLRRDIAFSAVASPRLRTLSQKFPGLLDQSINQLIRDTSRLLKDEEWKDFFNDCKLSHLSRVVDLFDVFLRDFSIDFLERNKSLLPRLQLSFDRSNSLFGQSSKEDLEAIVWQATVAYIRSLKFQLIIDSIKKIQAEHEYLTLHRDFFTDIDRARKIRNHYVHWGAIVNADFKRKIGLSSLVVGSKYIISNKIYLKSLEAMELMAISLKAASPANRDKLVRDAFKATLEKMSLGETIVLPSLEN